MVKCLPERIDSHVETFDMLEGAHMSWDEEERRVAEIFGVKEGEGLPNVSRQTLRTYHAKHVLSNVWCPHCRDMTAISTDFWGGIVGTTLVLRGTCVRCEGRVARVLEHDDHKENQ
jgi:hypothetical protein